MTDEKAKELVQKYFALKGTGLDSEFDSGEMTAEELADFAKFINNNRDRFDEQILNTSFEIRDLLRFMFIDRQHSEVNMLLRMKEQALHKNKYGVKENKEFKEANEDLVKLQNYVGLVGTQIMNRYSELVGGQLNYIRNLDEQIRRSQEKQAAKMTDGQKASEVDSTQGPEDKPNLIITP